MNTQNTSFTEGVYMLGRKNGDGESGLKESPNTQGHKNLPLDLVKRSDLVLTVHDLFPSKSEDI